MLRTSLGSKWISVNAGANRVLLRAAGNLLNVAHDAYILIRAGDRLCRRQKPDDYKPASCHDDNSSKQINSGALMTLETHLTSRNIGILL